MKRRIHFFSISMIWGTPAFLFLVALFLCGAIAGSFTGIMGGTAESVSRLTSYLTQGTPAAPSALQAVGDVAGTLLWLVISLVAGLLTPPSLFVAAVAAARGFTLSFAVAAVVSTLGMRGMWVSLVTTGLPAMVTVPCLLMTATAAFLSAGEAAHGGKARYWYTLGRYRGALALCALFSAAAALARALAAPLLLTLFS